MGIMQKLMGVVVGGSVGLLVASAIVPTADQNIFDTNLTSSAGAESLYSLLPLFLVVALVAAIVGYAVTEIM